jgi:hypothetical protein
MGNVWHVAVYERCPATHSRVVRSSNESTSYESPKIVTAFRHQIIHTHFIFLKHFFFVFVFQTQRIVALSTLHL